MNRLILFMITIHQMLSIELFKLKLDFKFNLYFVIIASVIFAFIIAHYTLN